MARSGTASVIGQVAGVAAALGVLAFRAPAHGPMLLIPVTDDARATLVRAALARGGALVAPGPLSGSLVVAGERTRLGGMPNVIVIAAPPRLCGAETGE